MARSGHPGLGCPDWERRHGERTGTAQRRGPSLPPRREHPVLLLTLMAVLAHPGCGADASADITSSTVGSSTSASATVSDAAARGVPDHGERRPPPIQATLDDTVIAWSGETTYDMSTATGSASRSPVPTSTSGPGGPRPHDPSRSEQRPRRQRDPAGRERHGRPHGRRSRRRRRSPGRLIRGQALAVASFTAKPRKTTPTSDVPPAASALRRRTTAARRAPPRISALR